MNLGEFTNEVKPVPLLNMTSATPSSGEKHDIMSVNKDTGPVIQTVSYSSL